MSALAARDSEEAAEGSSSAGSNLMEAEIQQSWLCMDSNTHTHLTAARRACAISVFDSFIPPIKMD